jgi:hypothetical protein
MRYPGRSRTVPYSSGSGTWAYKRQGEVAGDAVREVGVVSGTHEPGKNKSPGTVSFVARRAVIQKTPTKGKGPRWKLLANEASRRVGVHLD